MTNIDYICEKLNTTADALIPVLSEYEILTQKFSLILSLIGAACFIGICIYFYINHKDVVMDFYKWQSCVFVASAFIAFLLIINVIISGVEIYLWTICPEAKALEYVFG